MAFLANRDGFFSVFVKNGDSNEVAACTADTIVRDPVFAPVIEAAAQRPVCGARPGARRHASERVYATSTWQCQGA